MISRLNQIAFFLVLPGSMIGWGHRLVFGENERKSDVSTMPEGLLDTFKRSEILDLMVPAIGRAGEANASKAILCRQWRGEETRVLRSTAQESASCD